MIPEFKTLNGLQFVLLAHAWGLQNSTQVDFAIADTRLTFTIIKSAICIIWGITKHLWHTKT